MHLDPGSVASPAAPAGPVWGLIPIQECGVFYRASLRKGASSSSALVPGPSSGPALPKKAREQPRGLHSHLLGSLSSAGTGERGPLGARVILTPILTLPAGCIPVPGPSGQFKVGLRSVTPQPWGSWGRRALGSGSSTNCKLGQFYMAAAQNADWLSRREAPCRGRA